MRSHTIPARFALAANAVSSFGATTPRKPSPVEPAQCLFGEHRRWEQGAHGVLSLRSTRRRRDLYPTEPNKAYCSERGLEAEVTEIARQECEVCSFLAPRCFNRRVHLLPDTPWSPSWTAPRTPSRFTTELPKLPVWLAA